MSAASFDVALESLLYEWEPKIGPPTCGPGCSGCCERSTIFLSSAEALRIHNFVENTPLHSQWRVRAASLRDLVFEDAASAHNSLIDLGSCVFLDDTRRCGVYDVRPDACRACHVWHPAEFCSREDYDMCTPSELNALRVDRIHELMIEEFKQGRFPFWGQLLPMIAVFDEHKERYLNGEDIRSRIEPLWLETELIEFPDDRAFLEADRARLKQLFAEEENPMGYPRVAASPDRSFLAAFPLD